MTPLTSPRFALPCAALIAVTAAPTHAQFIDHFERGLEGWDFFTGDGAATMRFEATDDGFASIRVDATRDERNVWWALIRHAVSRDMDLGLLSRPGHELRVEARIRTSHAPRRVNLHLNTQRTTDFHSHLMEFDIPDTSSWHTISMTTRDFPAIPGDTVYGQLALMDWGLETYGVDIDYFRVDIVDASRAGPDHGEQVPYHPPVPDTRTFGDTVLVANDVTIDIEKAHTMDHANETLTVGGSEAVLLDFDLEEFAGRTAVGHGLLELTTRSVPAAVDSGLARVVEILDWDAVPVLNPQMIIDWPVKPGDGARTFFTISRPVLQRMIDGRTRGLAVTPLGPFAATFYALEHDRGSRAATLYFNTRE